MPLWSEILAEISSDSTPSAKAYDKVRRRYLFKLREHTKRNTILYASSWLQQEGAPPSQIAISDQDIHALMEVTSDLRVPDLDIILHSPGGSAVAAEAIVHYLRSRFDDIRVIVPNFAKSAATMIACSANKIVMGKHSFLGPTDPQIPLVTPLGSRLVPAQAILDQFELVKGEIRKQGESSSWSPSILQIGPDLIETCRNSVELSRSLVSDWLRDFMFEGDSRKGKLAHSISDWLSDHSNFKHHNRHLPRSELVKRGLEIEELEKDQTFQDLSLSVFHATTHLFSTFKVCKIVESHRGRYFLTVY